MKDITAFVSLLLALSIASERLVEIIKGFIPFLNQQNSDPNKEGRRRAILQIIAVIAGIVTTALLAKLPNQEIIPSLTKIQNWGIIIAIGLLASGGSGFWNSVLTSLTKIKDIIKLEAQDKKLESEEKKLKSEEKKPI
jgi:hypothetical protein